jgi:hypothetical protein
MDITKTQMKPILASLREMNAADRSILEALPENLKEGQPVRLVTMPGSANDQLWSKMVELQWMKLDQPLEEHKTSRVFLVLPEAREAIEELLIELKRDGLPTLFNELRRTIPPLIGPRVIDSGGTPSDLAMMLAGIVEATMRHWIRDELHEEFLKAVVDRARDLQQLPRHE